MTRDKPCCISGGHKYDEYCVGDWKIYFSLSLQQPITDMLESIVRNSFLVARDPNTLGLNGDEKKLNYLQDRLQYLRKNTFVWFDFFEELFGINAKQIHKYLIAEHERSIHDIKTKIKKNKKCKTKVKRRAAS